MTLAEELMRGPKLMGKARVEELKGFVLELHEQGYIKPVIAEMLEVPLVSVHNWTRAAGL